MGNYTTIVIDFETTGLSPGYGDRTIEVGAVLISSRQIVDRFQSLMTAEMRISGFLKADKLIEAVDKAAKSYPWPDTYKAFPGPNSNTFTASIANQVPELGLDLPFSAIGSGYAKTKVH